MAGAAASAMAPAPWSGHRALRSGMFWRLVAHLALDPVVAMLGLGVAAIAVLLAPWHRAVRRWVEVWASWERSRAARLIGAAIPGSAGEEAVLGRRIGYLAALPLLAAAAVTVLAVSFPLPLTLALLPLYLWAMPGGTVHLGPVTVGSEGAALLTTAAALVFMLLVAPVLVRGVAVLDRGTATVLLGPRTAAPDPALTRRVEELVVSRARVVDSLEAERRRIERNLHDGAQQRLVALALTIGRAQARLDPDAESAPAPDGSTLAVLTRLLDQAHDEADAAIAELRDLTRGLAPPVLAERGLDAALSGLAGRAAPLTVDLQVGADVDRLPRAVESVLYFVAAEALTNVSKHAGATRVTIALRREPAAAILTVTDDGGGGARTTDDGGLVGLADRLAGVDGTLRLHSPDGGPTVLTAEAPCG